MNISNFNFAQPLWLFALLLIPLALAWQWYWHKKHQVNVSNLQKFADPELLQHLLISRGQQKSKLWGSTLFALTIAAMIIALANPRWDYKEFDAYAPTASMVILLDLASTMNAQDITPSRIIAARQRIEDLLQQSKGLKVGLIGFAAYPHLISPITDDLQTIRAFLPAVDTDLINKQGMALSSGLKTAAELLLAEPGERKSVLLVSDGNFGKDNYEKIVKALVGQGIKVHVLGVGTKHGAPYKDQNGRLEREGNQVAISKLNNIVLQNIAQLGQGLYVETNYSDRGLQQILDKAQRDEANSQIVTGKVRQWEDRYYVFLLPAALLFLFLLRQRAFYSLSIIILVTSIYAPDSHAFELKSLFQNSAQRGQQEFKQANFNAAAELFSDPYQKGVALYRAGNFAAAEEAFKSVQRPEIENASIYNAGNAQMQQQKWHAAINSYERVLQTNPDHADAKFNLELARKMLAKNGDDHEDQDDKQQSDKDKQGDKQKNSKNNNDPEKKSDQKSEREQEQEQDNNKQQDQKQNDQKKNPQNEQDNKNGSDQDSNQDAKTNNAKDNIDAKNTMPDQKAKDLDAKMQAEKDARAQQWLNRINSDIKMFLRNKFYIEDMLSSK